MLRVHTSRLGNSLATQTRHSYKGGLLSNYLVFELKPVSHALRLRLTSAPSHGRHADVPANAEQLRCVSAAAYSRIRQNSLRVVKPSGLQERTSHMWSCLLSTAVLPGFVFCGNLRNLRILLSLTLRRFMAIPLSEWLANQMELKESVEHE
jgi:hypothetical protein